MENVANRRLITAAKMRDSSQRYRQLWKRSIYSVIRRSLIGRIARCKKLAKSGHCESMIFLEWRLAYNMYKSELYREALHMLERICGGCSNEGLENSRLPDSNVHLTAARCSAILFSMTKDHAYLKAANHHFQKTVDTLDIFPSNAKLSGVLHEFSTIAEECGAYQSAADLHARILTDFQLYRECLSVMYRSAIVGKHISSLVEHPEKKRKIQDKAIEALTFLLEALPSCIDEVKCWKC